jgi:NAD(P)-dependent dehydrogenase (short-subunit alcohol dehydrogenase family)
MSKVWLLTGASRGLGRAFTEEILKAGDRVVAAARNPEQLGEVASKFGESVRTVSLDVTNEAQAKRAVDAAIETFGGLDVLVNNAGYGNVCPVEDTPLADFRAQIETNLFGVIIMTKAVLPYLPNPLLRLLLGSDAYNAAEQHALQILGCDKEWKDLSISTDYKVANFV